MLKFYFLFISIFCISILFANVGPNILFTYTEFDAGNIIEGPNYTFKFPFKNIGDDTLIISSVKSSCGCLVPIYKYLPLLPNQWDTIYGVYNTNGRPGPCSKTITITSNDPIKSYNVLVLRCFTLSKKRYDIQLKDDDKTYYSLNFESRPFTCFFINENYLSCNYKIIEFINNDTNIISLHVFIPEGSIYTSYISLNKIELKPLINDSLFIQNLELLPNEKCFLYISLYDLHKYYKKSYFNQKPFYFDDLIYPVHLYYRN